MITAYFICLDIIGLCDGQTNAIHSKIALGLDVYSFGMREQDHKTHNTCIN